MNLKDFAPLSGLGVLSPQDLNGFADSIESEIVKPLAISFTKNISDVFSMAFLPYLIASFDDLRFNYVIDELKRVSKNHDLDNLQNDEILELGQRAADNLQYDIDNKKRIQISLDNVNSTFKVVIKEPQVHAGLFVLKKACLVLVWTAFESFATDIWVNMVNAYPDKLVQKVLQKSNEKSDESISFKSISMDNVYKNSFDLRNVMGSILYQKFDFTDLGKIKELFTKTFGTSFNDIFESSELSLIEALRHNIVHKAGVVDEKLIRRAKNIITIKLVEGEEVPITPELVENLVHSVIMAGKGLATIVANWEKAERVNPK